jgi:hypothetical protein
MAMALESSLRQLLETNDSLVTSSNVIDASSSVSDKQDSELPSHNETNNLAKSEVATEYLQRDGIARESQEIPLNDR